MAELVTTQVEGNVGVLIADSPPVNALAHRVRQAIWTGFEKLSQDSRVRAIVILCAGRTFFAGADISELDKTEQAPGFNTLFNRIEASEKPVIAAIHGTALGGGLELALSCHFRIAVPSAKLGLPEVHLGIIPGAGGTQRLPRLIGVEPALDMIINGRPIKAAKALELGILDEIVPEGILRENAVAFAAAVPAQDRPVVRTRDRAKHLEDPAGAVLLDEYKAKNPRVFRGFQAPGTIIEAVRAAIDLPFDEGLAKETELFRALAAGTQSAAQRYAFFAERDALKIPDVPADTPVLPIASVGVIGAGTMGGGIAMNFLSACIPVTLVERAQDALDRGVQVIRANYEATARKGRLTPDQVDRAMALLTPSLDLSALADADLIIEAAFESMAVKKDIFASLDRIAKPEAILASNTSFLDLDEIASATDRPEHVIGLHFFSPANVMPLLEVVRGEKTSINVIATAMKLARTIGKKPVLSRVCYGFIANRLMDPRLRQAEALTLEGPTPSEIDKVIRDYGFAMGPFEMIDLVGLDVIDRDSDVRSLRSELVALGRLGQKKNGGFYDYDEKRKATPSPVAQQVIEAFASSVGIMNRQPQSDERILARLLYPVVNEGAKILEEGIALRASDIDQTAILGYGWPVYTGGPMFWAGTVGLDRVVAGLKSLQAIYGDSFKPAKLLEDLAARNETFL